MLSEVVSGSGGAHVRVYIPVDLACRVIGLKVTRYGSGNVSGATLDGARISNTSAREMLASIDDIYYDAALDKFVGSHFGVAAALRERVAAMLPPVEPEGSL